MKKLIILIIMLITSTLAGYCPINNDTPLKLKFMQEKALFESEIYTRPFSLDLLWQALIFAEIKHPQIVYTQMVLETANFTSDLFRQGNNLTGMRLPRTRPSCATAIEYNYHATYAHWWDSVMDYKLFQDWYISMGYNIDNYYEFLTAMRYATDINYINKLKSIFDIA